MAVRRVRPLRSGTALQRMGIVRGVRPRPRRAEGTGTPGTPSGIHLTIPDTCTPSPPRRRVSAIPGTAGSARGDRAPGIGIWIRPRYLAVPGLSRRHRRGTLVTARRAQRAASAADAGWRFEAAAARPARPLARANSSGLPVARPNRPSPRPTGGTWPHPRQPGIPAPQPGAVPAPSHRAANPGCGAISDRCRGTARRHPSA